MPQEERDRLAVGEDLGSSKLNWNRMKPWLALLLFATLLRGSHRASAMTRLLLRHGGHIGNYLLLMFA